MKTRYTLAWVFLFSAAVLAGPARPVNSGSFAVQPPCGPPWDGPALQGQWFADTSGGLNVVNAWEYCDDDDSLSIAGTVVNIAFSNPTNPLSNIMAFDILATVSNTLPSEYQIPGNATNSHGQIQLPQPPPVGAATMREVRITAEFSLADISMIPNGPAPPYYPDPVSGGSYHIVALNEDLWAWYCWDPGSGLVPPGNFQVPAWNLVPFDIPPGGSAQVLMQFMVTGSGMPIADYRHSVIRASLQAGFDVLYNRHPSLKISHWLDTLLVDNGYNISTPLPPWWQEEPIEYVYASDASVFFNLEEEPEYPHKMHWPQLPDPNGWDVRACSVPPTDPDPDGLRKVLADDFLCTSNGFINHITFWGSWFSNLFLEAESYQGITNIHLSIHADIPAGQLAEWSMPQIPALWEIDFNPTSPPTGWILLPPAEEPPSAQGWYDPNLGLWQTNNHTRYFRYEIIIPNEMALLQEEGVIYWLDISVDTEIGLWGWKTSASPHFNDDAVWADLPVHDPSQWNELRDPITGESLDLAFIINEYEPEVDWGDAPDAQAAALYPTLAVNSGASHTIIPGIHLGAGVDGEPDGQPDPQALGDDNDILYPPPNDDEDGVSLTPLVPGLPAALTVTASVAGSLDAWIDYNANGSWADAGEQILGGSIPLNAGANVISFMVPASATPTLSTFARFRFSTAGGLSFKGPATDGEIEDYEVMIDDPIDWGDAPDPAYPTLAASGGAFHLIGGPYLGAAVDPDPDGQPTPLADGDDLDAQGDDEDGVTFLTPLVPGAVAQVNVVLGGIAGAGLDAWVDFNANGSWIDPGEQVFTNVVLGLGTNALYFSVPAGSASMTNTYARFRVSSTGGLPPTGYGQDGEVEDYMVRIDEALAIDWGDAPATYRTLAMNNGAHHLAVGSFLGKLRDTEADGQPNAAASGDDVNGSDDEDGLLFLSNLMPGGCARMDVIASGPGLLDAWLDFNADGDWLDAGERIFTGQPLGTGVTVLAFSVPLSATNTAPAGSFLRLRFSSGGVANFSGFSSDGEVEDHPVSLISNPKGDDWGDAPTNFPAAGSGYPTVGAAGAVHVILAGLQLGAAIDPEINGQPDSSATGDDIMGMDDEDGIVFKTKLVAGQWATIDVMAGTAGGALDAWIDFNADGAWSSIEQIKNAASLSPGVNTMTFYVPQPSAIGPTFARFRLSAAGGLPPAGGAPVSGEVEDYMVNLYQPQPPTNIVITNLFFTASNTVAQVEWNSLTNFTYQLQMSTNLTTNVWMDVEPQIMGPTNWQTNGVIHPLQFYRIVAPWTP